MKTIHYVTQQHHVSCYATFLTTVHAIFLVLYLENTASFLPKEFLLIQTIIMHQMCSYLEQNYTAVICDPSTSFRNLISMMGLVVLFMQFSFM